jgi:outer membrane protein TolC
LVSFTQTRYAQAQGRHNEYLRAQLELVKTESERLENAEALKKTAAWFVYLAGGPLSVESLWAEPLPERPEGDLSADSAVALAAWNSPQIKMLAASEEKARFEKNLAAKGYWPDFEIGFFYEQDIDHFRPDRLMNVYGGRVGFRLPLFFWASRSREVQGKKLEAEQVSLLRKNMENKVRAEAEMRLAEIGRLAGQVRLYKEELLPRARLLVEESQTAYTVGRLSFPDFSEAQLEQIELERNYHRFLADYWKAKAELEKTVGLD